MIFYTLNIIILTMLWLVLDRKKICINGITYTKNKFFCIVASLNWILLSGLRHIEVGPDTMQYKLGHFDVTLNTSWLDIIHNITEKYVYGANIKDPGYALLEKIFQIFSDNYQLWLITIAIFFFSLMGDMISKYSRNPYISFVLFSTLFYSFFAITGHRQTIATALVVFIGTKYILENNLMFFTLLVLISMTIHTSAICFFPFYWLSKIKINKLSLCCYWGLIIVAFIFRNQFLSFLQYIIGYEQYTDNDGAGVGTFIVLLILISLFASIFNKNINLKNKFNEISFNALLTACIFSSLVLINQSCMRVVQYYSLFLLFFLPELLDILKTKKMRQLITMIGVMIMIGLMMIRNPQYMFFWE